MMIGGETQRMNHSISLAIAFGPEDRRIVLESSSSTSVRVLATLRRKQFERKFHAEDRIPKQQTGGPSVQNKGADRSRHDALVTGLPNPAAQSYSAGMRKLLSLLHRRKSPVVGSGLLCRGPHLAIPDEEAWSSPSETDAADSFAKSASSHA
jgi:hypothetical protein